MSLHAGSSSASRDILDLSENDSDVVMGTTQIPNSPVPQRARNDLPNGRVNMISHLLPTNLDLRDFLVPHDPNNEEQNSPFNTGILLNGERLRSEQNQMARGDEEES